MPDTEQAKTTSRPRRVNPPPKSVNKPEPVPEASAKTARECDSFLSKNSINSGIQWAVIWLVGWLPIGILFSSFYDSIRAGNPKWYSNYPRTWDTTLPGMLTTYGIGSLLGGFIAGLLIYRLLNTKKLNMGVMGTLPALAWGFLWGGVLAIMTLPLEKYMDDGTLIITIPIFALIFGGLISRFSIQLLEKKYAFSVTKRVKMFITGGWAASSLIGVIVAMVISGVLAIPIMTDNIGHSDELIGKVVKTIGKQVEIEQEAENFYEKAQNYFYGRKGEKKDYTKALEFYHKAVNMGSLNAMNSIGYMYGTGKGVTKNHTKAVEWFRKSAKQGNAKAKRNLGIMYENGRGVTKDNKVAFEWYLKAAKQGNEKAQSSIGIMYENGKGIAQDNKAAVQWYIKAAKQGNAVAQSNLGNMYFRGTGIARNYQEAAQWFRKSADQGHANAQYNLGVIYDQGRGVPENDVTAITWYRKAAENGSSNAKKALIRLGQ